MCHVKAALAALIALGLTVPADARTKIPPQRKATAPRTVCVSYFEPGVGPAQVCATAAR